VRIFISAGDPSGDRHAADLIRELRSLNADVEIEGFGGHLMAQAGADLMARLAEQSIIGVAAVLPRLFFYRRLLKEAVARMQERRTDVLVLVDYPGFNLRLAEAAKRAGIKTVYYIGPQIWAWGAGRVERIKRVIDLMLVVFEFEIDLYERAGVPVRFVGHPLLDQLDFDADPAGFRRREGLDAETPLLGLIPGSRMSEVNRLFPVMLEAGAMVRRALGRLQLAVAVAPGLDPKRFEYWMNRTDVSATVLEGRTHALMQAADLALVTSGTATLETALLGTPELVLYRTDVFTYYLARLLIKLPRIGLVNVVAQRELAPEFIQHRCMPDAVAKAAMGYLRDQNAKTAFGPVAYELRTKLGKPGAAERAAQAIVECAQL